MLTCWFNFSVVYWQWATIVDELDQLACCRRIDWHVLVYDDTGNIIRLMWCRPSASWCRWETYVITTVCCDVLIMLQKCHVWYLLWMTKVTSSRTVAETTQVTNRLVECCSQGEVLLESSFVQWCNDDVPPHLCLPHTMSAGFQWPQKTLPWLLAS